MNQTYLKTYFLCVTLRSLRLCVKMSSPMVAQLHYFEGITLSQVYYFCGEDATSPEHPTCKVAKANKYI